jgi:DNA-binding response OmpR family regulator
MQNNKKPPKLLIIDDEETIVNFTKRFYEKKGFTVFGATDGVTGVELFRKERPEVTIIDIHMPFSPIDGIETLQKIKEIDKDAPCIMATRITEKDKIESAKKYGASCYLVKPFMIKDLDKAIKEAAKIEF